MDKRTDGITGTLPVSSGTDSNGQVLSKPVDRRLDASDGPIRVLVADSNATVRKILRHMLTSLNCETVEAADGEQAIQLAETRPQPKAIIVDANLSKIDGCQVCRRLKMDEFFQLVPIIVITDTDCAEEKMRVLDVGADDILTKPVNRAELTFRMRALLRIQEFNQKLIGAESVAMALARAVAAKDGYSHAHVERVATLSVILSKSLGLDATELKIIRYGAILHNVGKISIPDAVLEKTGSLTPREKAMFQQHPRVGCDICGPLKPLRAVVPIIRHHKEHWKGTGFPDGLRGNEIPLGAQIVGLVDAYVAMTSNRPFRKAATHEEAICQLQQQVEEGFYNPELVERLKDCLATKASGQPVEEAAEEVTSV